MSENHSFLKFKCIQGLNKKNLNTKEYLSRLDYELSIIEKMGFSDYFLIVTDVLDWARDQGIQTGPGRGSVAGSLVAYSLSITTIDPLKYDLIFERFLSSDRIAPPDIDFDLPDNKRDVVIQYVRTKYGSGQMASIATYGTFKSKGAIKAATRTLGYDYITGENLAKLTLLPIDGKTPSLEKCYEEVDKLSNFHEKPDTVEGKILKWADQIEGRIDHSGTHASGIVISDIPLNELIPLAKDKKDQVITEWDMHNIETAGLVKFDFLGLTTLTVISETIELVKQRHNKKIDLYTVPLDDKDTFKRLQKGDTAAIFQVESSSGIRDLMVQMRPINILDLASLVAIFRPGPLGSDYLEQWLKVRQGQDKPVYLVPELKPILSSTDGWMIYQEQVIQIARDLAGFTAIEGDYLRKIVGKKLPEEMKTQEVKFKSGMVKNRFDKDVADILWSDIKTFAGYGFNKAHAIAYAYLTYYTAWLKTHFTVEYMCAALNCNQSDPNQVIKYVFNCRELGIKVLPPDINISHTTFSIDKENNIRFGLAAIKNLGSDMVEYIVKLRKNKTFTNILEFISRVDIGKVNKRRLESLILAGAFDSIGPNRASMLQAVDGVINYNKLHTAYTTKLDTFNKKLEAYKARNEQIKLAEIAGLKTKLKPFKNPEAPEQPVYPKLDITSELSSKQLLKHERDLLGYYISDHPISKYKQYIDKDSSLTTTQEAKIECENTDIISIIAVPNSVQERTSKSSGKKMASMLLEDHLGAITATCFTSAWEQFSHIIELNDPLKFRCKVNVQESITGDTITELIILDISAVPENVTVISDTMEITVPAKLISVGELYKLLNKYSGEESKIRIKLLLENKQHVVLKQLFRLSNRDRFMEELKLVLNENN